LPTVTVNAATGRVEITLFWRTPQMPTSGANSSHRHVVVSQIVRNP
jgi:hypothetical protein